MGGQLAIGRADAVMVPESFKSGRRQCNRLDSIIALAAPLLGVAGGRAIVYVRQQAGPTCGREEPMLFCSRDHRATLLYPKADPKGRRGPRYRWEGDGVIAVGYLLDPEDRAILYEGTDPRR